MSTTLVFHAKGSSFTADLAAGGGVGVQFNSGKISTASGGISGTVWDLTDTSGVKFLSYPGAYNTQNSRAWSVLFRIAPGYTGTPAGSRAFGCLTAGVGATSAYFEWRHDITTANLTMASKNETSATYTTASFGTWSPTSGTFYDVVFVGDGTTTANNVKCYVDASAIGSGLTPTTALTSSWANTWFKSICIGSSPNTTASAFKLDEFAIWDGVIDPTSVALTSGTGSLNGASRSALLAVTAFGGPFTGSRGRWVNK